MPQIKFDAVDFIRRQEAGEFDETLETEIEKLSLMELEELAFLVLSQRRVHEASGAA